MYNLIHLWARIFLRLYFRRTIVYGRDQVPSDGPLIVASNHPSAFMEASVLATVIRRPLHFLVRGDVFHPRFRWLFNWTNQIPIYRQKDGISNLRKNASSFDLTYKRLSEGHAVLIFPEAKTTLEKKMRPIQRGTAHLAFGTLPFLQPGETLKVIPVGVNFMNPRIPGTDVIVRFGQPFIASQGSREDRDAIEAFTKQLSDSLEPLLVQIPDNTRETQFDTLASIYLMKDRLKRFSPVIHDDLVKMAAIINRPEANPEINGYIESLLEVYKKHGIMEAIYFPFLVRNPGWVLAVLGLLKSIWFLAGGWIWRVTRSLIFSKIKTDTFQGPSSLGAAMVVFPVVTFVLLLLCLWTGCPVWWIAVWLGLLALGKLIPFPLSLLLKIWILPNQERKKAALTIRRVSQLLIDL